MNATKLARILFADDFSRREDVDVEPNGTEALRKWEQAAAAAGDADTLSDIKVVVGIERLEREFAVEWERLYAARQVPTVVRLDDGDGNELANGLDVHTWRRHACSLADRLGATVYVSSSDASIGDDYAVEPGSKPEEI